MAYKEELWSQTLNDYLKEELNEFIFREYFEPIVPMSLENDVFYLQVPNQFHHSLIVTNYSVLINEALKFYHMKPIAAEFIVASANNPVNEDNAQASFRKQESDSKPENSFFINFNTKYTFDSFIVGPNNRFAHAAAYAVAENPAKKYNPLFIYGGVGLGKTHLMHAIGHQILKNDPTRKVVYVSSEKFTNEFIDAIQKKTNIQFRNKYRNVDVLLIDDIQFFAGKKETQEEFFHTFNDLHGSNKQIILTSDRPPREIPALEERLSSRFGWGLICDISAPDYETRAAILRQKALEEKFVVDDEILNFIAYNVKSNIRELEGFLLKIKVLSEISDSNLSLELVKDNLKDLIIFSNENISMDSIVKNVCNYYKVSKDDIFSKNRTKEVAYARQIAMYLSRDLTQNSLPYIGQYFGGRDHSTVIHGCEKIKQEINNDVQMEKEIERLINEIKNNNI